MNQTAPTVISAKATLESAYQMKFAIPPAAASATLP